MTTITIDFETRSECDIRECGAAVYAQHPTTEILCMYYSIGNGPVKAWLPNGLGHLQFQFMTAAGNVRKGLRSVITAEDTPPEWITKQLWRRGYRVEAQNVFFEMMIWKHILHERFGLPDLPLNCCQCSAALASSLALPRALDDLGAAIGADVVKDEEGRRVMLQLSQPRAPSKTNPDTFFEIDKFPEKFAILYSYCRTDVVAEKSAVRILGELPPEERLVWYSNEVMNHRGVMVDAHTIDSALTVIDSYERACKEELVELTGGFLSNVSQVVRVREYLEGRGVITSDLTAATVERLLQKPKLDEKARRVLEIRSSLSQTSTKKLKRMKNSISRDGTIKDISMYHGASTGRTTGKGTQILNLARGELGSYIEKGIVESEEDLIFDINTRDWRLLHRKYGDVMTAISSALRSLLVPPAGYEFIVADFNAIEARVLLWLAGQEDAVETFRLQDKGLGPDIYKSFGAAFSGKTVDEITKDERQFFKQVVLGSGYQMGAAKFRVTCEAAGVSLTDEQARDTIQKYRSIYYKVPELWKAAEQASLEAVLRGRRVSLLDKITFEKRGDFLKVKLPSGRELSYYDPKIDSTPGFDGRPRYQVSYMGVNSTTRKWERQHIYGGKWAENFCQAIARDIMVAACSRLEEKNYLTNFTIYDEIVLLAPEEFGSVEEVETIMSESPLPWGADLPIRAEGWRGKRYRK